jgi:hypothetical protein
MSVSLGSSATSKVCSIIERNRIKSRGWLTRFLSVSVCVSVFLSFFLSFFLFLSFSFLPSFQQGGILQVSHSLFLPSDREEGFRGTACLHAATLSTPALAHKGRLQATCDVIQNGIVPPEIRLFFTKRSGSFSNYLNL